MRQFASFVALHSAMVALMGHVHLAYADDNHYQNYLVGDRAVGLGGAYTAIAADGSAVFYNPAGLAELAGSSLSISAGIYGFSSENVDVEVPGFTERGHNSNRTFISYPTTAAWILRARKGGDDGVGRVQLALALITPQSNVTRRRFNVRLGASVVGVSAASDSISVVLAEDDTLWVGVASAYRATRWLAVGGGVHVTIRSARYQSHVYNFLETRLGAVVLDQRSRPSDLVASLLHFGLVGQLGVLLRPLPELCLGATFRTPQLRLTGSVDYNALDVPEDERQKPQVTTTQSGEFVDYQPWKTTLGVAYVRPQRFGASLDFSLYGPVGLYNSVVVDNAGWLPQKKRFIWQLNVGGELYIARRFPLRAGFFTNLSSLDVGDTCSTLAGECGQLLTNPATDAIDRLGVAASLGYQIEHAALTLAWEMNFGQRRIGLPATTLDISRMLMFFVLGGSFRF